MLTKDKLMTEMLDEEVARIGGPVPWATIENCALRLDWHCYGKIEGGEVVFRFDDGTSVAFGQDPEDPFVPVEQRPRPMNSQRPMTIDELLATIPVDQRNQLWWKLGEAIGFYPVIILDAKSVLESIEERDDAPEGLTLEDCANACARVAEDDWSNTYDGVAEEAKSIALEVLAARIKAEAEA